MSHSRLYPLIACALLCLGWPDARAANSDLGDKILETTLATRADVAAAVAELNKLRAAVDAERAPLADKLQVVGADVRELRATAERLRQLRYQGDLERQALADEVQALEDEASFIHTALLEYRRATESRLEPAESQMLAARFAPIDRALAVDDGWASLPAAADALLQLAAEWNRAKLGGAGFDGPCLDAAGSEWRGRYTIFGPVTYFAAAEAPAAGIVVNRLGSSMPSLFPAKPEMDPAPFRALAQGDEALVPVDVSSGDALKVVAARESLLDHARSGGFTMIPLLAIGGLALLLATWKFISLAGINTRPASSLDQLAECVNRGDVAGAEAIADKLGGPVGSIMRAGIQYRAAPREHLEEILHERVLGCLPSLDRHLGILAVLGGVAPLLGLLGTVTGMIHTFQLVTIFGTGDAKLLSGGISEALVTTETGLIIAVPVLLIHAYLARRVRTIIGGLEQTAVGYINRVKS